MVTIDKLKNNTNIKSVSFETYQDASDFIWNEFKGLKKFNFCYSTKKKGWLNITHLNLKDSNTVYIIKNKKPFFKENIIKIGMK